MTGIPDIFVTYTPKWSIITDDGGVGPEITFVRMFSFIDGRYQPVYTFERGNVSLYTDNTGQTVVFLSNSSWDEGAMYSGYFELSLNNGRVSLQPIVGVYNRTRVLFDDFDFFIRNYATGAETPIIPGDFWGHLRPVWVNVEPIAGLVERVNMPPYILTMPNRTLTPISILTNLQNEVTAAVRVRLGLE